MYKHQPQLRATVSNSQQAIFDQGTSVGKLAEQLFPGGVDARPKDTYSYQESVLATYYYIQEGHSTIYEAAFQHDNVLAALDILVKKKGKWHAYEVKSSTSVKDTFLQDAALQYYVITQMGLPLVDFSIVYINNDYERYGDLDIHQLFTIESVLEQVLELQPQIAAKIAELKEVLQQKKSPDRAIGPHCSDPYACDFMEHCWQHVPEDSVFDLRGHGAGAKAFDLYEQGILHLSDIPDDYPLHPAQIIQVQCHRSGQPYIEQEALDSFLDRMEYPLYFMDFETYQVAVPEWDGTRPYQQIPFQFSVHRQDSPGGPLTHFEWLAPSGTDPRKEFLANLLEAVGKKGLILAYNSIFEMGRLNDLAYWFPKKAKAIDAILARTLDLMYPFRKKHYYLPAMKGSYSIKQVLPALVPDMNYDELEIGNGGDASTAFYHLQFETDASLVEQTRKALLRYCAMDTEAMVRVLEGINVKKK